ncbi:MAG: glycoside hydrolase family 38 C-terminal domain-containing protein [Christensenellales bacterium]
MKKCFLICNSHIDPVWQWEWEEGVSAGVATFNSAVKLLKEYDFIFCHNEAVLYEWAKEYDEGLFREIKELVKAGKWHIMSGWYLQPDCDIPCGESIIRQIMVGRRFFKENFDYNGNDTAINFDSFGHSAGLPQILKKCGYNNYVFCRPNRSHVPDYVEEYIWEGCDGSRIRCYHSSKIYCSGMGNAKNELLAYLESKKDMDTALYLWGVGNHGGGPSRKDLEDIAELAKTGDVELVHSTPEEYFSEKKDIKTVFRNSLGPFAPGCYTSVVNVKQMHFAVENLLYSTEKMAAVADMLGIADYDFEGFEYAEKKMLFCEFHDILPGSSIAEIEKYALSILGAAYDRLSRIRAKLIFAFTYLQEKSKEGVYPNFAYNPHPYPVHGQFEFEFMLSSGYNLDQRFTDFDVYVNGEKVKSQVVKERSQLNLEWRKRVVVDTTLPATSLTRFDMVEIVKKDRPVYERIHGKYVFSGSGTEITFNCDNGLVESLVVDEKEYLKSPIQFEIWQDTADAWAISPAQNKTLATKAGSFRLMTEEEARDYCKGDTKPVQMTEDGDVYTVIEALYVYNKAIIKAKYRFVKSTGELEIMPTVINLEANTLIKLVFPTTIDGKYVGQVMFGEEELNTDDGERVAQKWTQMTDGAYSFSVINKATYGSCAKDGDIKMTLLRTPVYCCHYIEGVPYTTPERTYKHMEQGEREFYFNIKAGKHEDIARSLDRRAKAIAEAPFLINIYPQNDERKGDIDNVIVLGDETADVSAIKKSRDGGYILRLFNPSASEIETNVEIPIFGINKKVGLKKFEVKTFRFDKDSITECEQMEI